MNRTQFLIGCMLAFGGARIVSAADVDMQDLVANQHATVDTATAHDSAGGSDVNPARDCGLSCSTSSEPSTGDNENSGETGRIGAHPRPSHRSNLGWQSLLPGSIQ